MMKAALTDKIEGLVTIKTKIKRRIVLSQYSSMEGINMMAKKISKIAMNKTKILRNLMRNQKVKRSKSKLKTY